MDDVCVGVFPGEDLPLSLPLRGFASHVLHLTRESARLSNFASPEVLFWAIVVAIVSSIWVSQGPWKQCLIIKIIITRDYTNIAHPHPKLPGYFVGHVSVFFFDIYYYYCCNIYHWVLCTVPKREGTMSCKLFNCTLSSITIRHSNLPLVRPQPPTPHEVVLCSSIRFLVPSVRSFCSSETTEHGGTFVICGMVTLYGICSSKRTGWSLYLWGDTQWWTEFMISPKIFN